MSYGVFIVDEDSIQPEGICRAVLGYRNAIAEAVATGASEDPAYPLLAAFDHSYNTEYSPTHASTVTITFSFSGVQTINYFGVISKNAQESALSFNIELLNPATGLYEVVAGFGSMTNGVPSMAYFGSHSALAVRVTINYTSKPYIMTMFCGEAIVFPRTLSLGAQPGHLSNIDEVEIFFADEGLNIAPSRRLPRGYQLKGAINFVKMTTIEQFWKEYSNHVKDVKTLFFMWNDKLPGEVIYGVQIPDRLTKPAYKTSLFTQVEFDIIGWA
jgi:hypothetical protein